MHVRLYARDPRTVVRAGQRVHAIRTQRSAPQPRPDKEESSVTIECSVRVGETRQDPTRAWRAGVTRQKRRPAEHLYCRDRRFVAYRSRCDIMGECN